MIMEYYNQGVEWLYTLPVPAEMITVAIILAKIGLIVSVLLGGVSYLTLAERWVIGAIQARKGPNRVGPFGLLQPMADGIKALFKEINVPSASDKVVFYIAPIMSIAPALAAWATVPFSKDFGLVDLNVGLMYILAMTSISIYGVIFAGWASNSRYATLSAMRSAAQMISYEIAMGFGLLGVVLACGSLNLREIVMAQEGGFWNWYWIPLFPLLIVYFISGVAETNRAPFDVVEGESEIVTGFMVEYSGMTFAMFFMAEYANMILISVLTSILFLGGWMSPFAGIPVLGDLFDFVPGIVWLFAKSGIFLFIYLWIRATFPRYRYDQIMQLGWKVLIPISCLWVVVVCGFKIVGFGPWFS